MFCGGSIYDVVTGTRISVYFNWYFLYHHCSGVTCLMLSEGECNVVCRNVITVLAAICFSHQSTYAVYCIIFRWPTLPGLFIGSYTHACKISSCSALEAHFYLSDILYQYGPSWHIVETVDQRAFLCSIMIDHIGCVCLRCSGLDSRTFKKNLNLNFGRLRTVNSRTKLLCVCSV